MKQKIRLEGVYDDTVAHFMKKKGINEYTFDFRPKSFNYIQKYRFEEIMAKFYFLSDRYYLHFCNEKSHIIQRIVKDLKTLLKRPFEAEGNIFLEFSDHQNAAWYDHFGHPFYWHYHSCENVEDILHAQNLHGIVLDFEYWNDYCAHQYLDQFAVFLYRQMQSSRLKDNLRLILSIDWDSNIPPGIEEYFDFDLISLPINAKIESGYRQINYELLSRELRIERF